MFAKIIRLTACALFGALLTASLVRAGGTNTANTPPALAPVALACPQIDGCVFDCVDTGRRVETCETVCMERASRKAAAVHGLVERCLERQCAYGECASDVCETELAACYD